VRFPAFDVDDEADAAGVVLVLRVVQSLCFHRDELRAEPLSPSTDAEVKYNDRIQSMTVMNDYKLKPNGSEGVTLRAAS
jgi:hypothetical protein